MASFGASLLGVLLQIENLAMASVVAAFFALALRALAMPFVDRGRHAVIHAVRIGAGLAFFALGTVYAMFTAGLLVWNLRAALVALGMAALILVKVGVRHVLGRKEALHSPALTGALVQLVLLLALLLVAGVTLMRAGFVSLTADRIVLMVDVTGETGVQSVSWAPPDQPLREEKLVTHRVVMRTSDDTPITEAWIYGDEVAVKGRVLRLAPGLNAAGVPNLFELSFVHNGYETAERHNAYPHVALPLPPIGPLAVHPWWRPLQRRLLEHWEAGTAGDSPWLVRSATTESTYFPLVDASGKPVRQSYRLVLTPGGFSSS
jgi:hypothetical protein